MARILSVDDDELISAVLVRALRDAGHEVHAAATGDEAVRLVGAHRFDVAVVDLELPGADGLSVLAAIRGAQPACGRILSSGRLDLQSVVAAVNRGEIGRVLSKPYQPQALLEAVSEQLTAAETRQRAWRQAVDLERSAWFHEAVAAGQLHLAFQPIVDAASGAMVAQEGLVRGFHPRLRTPGDILAVAEGADLLGELATVVAARGAEQLARADAADKLFLNMHPRDFGAGDLQDRLAPLLPWADRVVLEITERAAIHEVPDGHATICRLAELGFSIAVDDLGAGYSSLSMLAELDPRYIKVDMSIIRGIDRAPHKQRLLELLCRFADAGGATLIAEGIETEAEAEVTRRCGAHWLQGYRFGRPALPAPAPARAASA